MRIMLIGTLFLGLSAAMLGCSTGHQPQRAQLIPCQHPPALIHALRADGVVMIRRGDQILFLLPTDRFFSLKGAELLPEREKSMNRLAALLKTYGKDRLYIYGFTDEVGSAERNRALSHLQAQTIAAHLWERGIRFKRLSVKGFGERPAVASNGYPIGSLKNRRIEISLIDRGVCDR